MRPVGSEELRVDGRIVGARKAGSTSLLRSLELDTGNGCDTSSRDNETLMRHFEPQIAEAEEMLGRGLHARRNGGEVA